MATFRVGFRAGCGIDTWEFQIHNNKKTSDYNYCIFCSTRYPILCGLFNQETSRVMLTLQLQYFGRRSCVLLLFRLLLCPQLNSIEGRRDPPDPLSGLGKEVNIQDKLSIIVVVLKYLQTSPSCQWWLSNTFTNVNKLSAMVITQCNTNITAVFYFSCVERRFGGGKTEEEQSQKERCRLEVHGHNGEIKRNKL